MREVDEAVCPYCETRVDDLGVLEVDNQAVGDRMRAVEAALCPSCGKILGTYSYGYVPDQEAEGEKWGRVKGIDEPE